MARPRLRAIPLGGIGEVGKNMMIVEYRNDIVMIDSGTKFPEEEMRGIDLVIPDISYIIENIRRFRAILLTHGHEDHIGSLPYILPQLERIKPVPIYGSPLALAFARSKLAEANVEHLADFVPIDAGQQYSIGTSMKVEFIPVTHSIPGAMAISIDTPVGRLVHTGDFKFDPTPPLGPPTDERRLKELGDQGTLVLFSDAVRVERPGRTPSEADVSATLDRIIAAAPGRVILTSFASNILRLEQTIQVGARHGRKVAVVGRSMEQSVQVAMDLGYIQPPRGTLLPIDQVTRLPKNQVLILTTGSQGEASAALARMASGDHPKLRIQEGDTVILSATPVPGNEETVSQTIDNLFRKGANVIYSALEPNIHVSGHSARDELRMMIDLLRPQFVVPIHGEYRHLSLYKDLVAIPAGIPPRNVIIPESGVPLSFSRGDVRKDPPVKYGAVLVDALGGDRYRNVVLRHHDTLATAQVIIATLIVDLEQGIVIAGPELTSKGFDDEDGHKLIAATEKELHTYLERQLKKGGLSYGYLVGKVKDVVARSIFQKAKLRPMVVPVVMEL
ncbi:MAG: RNase J family beta-CASP ribonuclease [Chloroflexi bacterium]|nr:MAG: RNase J family beta-CASP ribonuclease [Chloroflexota bacterium]